MTELKMEESKLMKGVQILDSSGTQSVWPTEETVPARDSKSGGQDRNWDSDRKTRTHCKQGQASRLWRGFWFLTGSGITRAAQRDDNRLGFKVFKMVF